jgi:PAS domain S-box-containing protein
MTTHDRDLEYERLLKLLWEQASEHALILLDPQGTITHWLGAAETVFGYQMREVVGRRHSILFTPEDVQALGLPTKS